MLPDLSDLLPSYELSLQAERKSPQTIKVYGDGVRAFVAWCQREGHTPELSRRLVAGFVASLLADGSAPATARSRQLAVRRFSAWLVEEGEMPTDQLIGIKAPQLDTAVVEPLTTDEIKALLKACVGPTMMDRRDEAILRFMLETGARAGEVAVLGVADLNLTEGTCIVRRGKGGRGRSLPFGPQTARPIDRYLRLRRTHRLAATPGLWLGERGKTFSYDSLHKTLTLRASIAGVTGFHPHKLRHTAAHRWLDAATRRRLRHRASGEAR